ncbi:MAG: hypothetical protein ACP5N1_03995 [Candidatus Woesearchaeota archaeon]
MPPEKKSPWDKVYDSTTAKFITRKDGISEEFLNKINSERYTQSDYLNYFKFVDSLENIGTWDSLAASEAGISELCTLVTTIHNFHMISKVDNSSKDTLNLSLIPMKEFILSLDSIYYQNLNDSEKIRKMYNLLTDKIVSGKLTSGSVCIEHLVNGQLGDCNDVVPAFYSVLTYYGFDVYMRFGKSKDDQGKVLGYHAWLGIDLKEGYADLDPTWYSAFVPLENRCKYIEYVSINDDYITKKAIK